MRQNRHTERGFDRLVNFSDAVVAIAITLLVLPLVEIAGQLALHETPGALLAEYGGTIWGFVISFVVLADYWLIHHRIFEWIGDYDSALAWLNIGWLFSIVILPFSTETISTRGFADGWGMVYTANLAVISAFMALIGWRVQRTPALQASGFAPHRMRLLKSSVFAGYFLAVGVLSLFQPAVASYAMLGLFPLGILLGRSENSGPDDSPDEAPAVA